MRTLSLLFMTTTLMAGCATAPGPNRYQAELADLEASCTARGGILQPTGGKIGVRPQEDYACRITGGPSDRLRPAS